MKRVVLLLCLLILSSVGFTQDPEFTQFYANPIYLNPAMAGAKDCPQLHLNNRNQWANISGTYVTNSISYDQYVPALNGGLAFMITQDNAGGGILNTTTISTIYSYHLDLSPRYRLLLAGEATWSQRFLDWNKLTFGDQIDPIRGFIHPTGDLPSGRLINGRWGTKGYFDVSTGFVIYSEKFYFGGVARHLNTPDQSMTLRNSILPMRFTGHIGMNLPLPTRSKSGEQAMLSPNIIYTYQNGFQQLNLGASVNISKVTFGAAWRVRDAFILLMGISTPKLDIGYSYDITISELTNISGGAHELSIGFRFSCKEHLKKFRTITCPSF